jgi:hypothetical protein
MILPLFEMVSAASRVAPVAQMCAAEAVAFLQPDRTRTGKSFMQIPHDPAR